MGNSNPKFPKDPLDRSNHDKANEVVFPDEDNVMLDHNDKLEQYYVAYSTVTFELKEITKYEIEEETYRTCEDQRGELHFFKMKNILENHPGDEIFLKVIDFNPEVINLPDLHPKKIKNMKLNKRLFKETMLLSQLQARFLNKPVGFFNNRDSQRVYVMFDYIDNRIHDLIIGKKLGPFLNKMRLFKNLIDMLIFLHINGIISYDISPFSIGVYGEKNEVKLLTLGNSVRLIGEAIDILRESWFDRSKFDFFIAPELYLNKQNLLRYCWAADIWSLGVLAYTIFRDDSYSFYDKLDSVFAEKEKDIYTEDRQYVAEKFYETFDVNKIDNPFMKAVITSMIKMEFTERPNIFEVADNYNKVCRFMELDEEYEIVYKKNDVIAFTKIYDRCTFELICDQVYLEGVNKN